MQSPVSRFLGNNLLRIADVFDTIAPRTVFLVTSKSSYVSCSAEAKLMPLLHGRDVVHFREYSPNPTTGDLERGLEVFRARRPDVVIAVGGGSAIDIAKLINTCGVHDGEAGDFIHGRRSFETRGRPLLAVPTTAGTGAEVTRFAVVYGNGRKFSVVHDFLLPDHYILDPSLTASLPPRVAASTGMDTLGHAFESYWSVGSTVDSRACAREAIVLAIDQLGPAVCCPSEAAREAMLRAANLSGRAINVSMTSAPHALSYAFTLRFGVPHGHAVGLTLGAVFAENAEVTSDDVIDGRGIEFVKERMAELGHLIGAFSPTEGSRVLSHFMATLGLETRLRDLGVTRADLPGLVDSVNQQRLANNPRRLSPARLGRILESIY
jgi:alcohol dehydrogenase class IV